MRRGALITTIQAVFEDDDSMALCSRLFFGGGGGGIGLGGEKKADLQIDICRTI
jgi:hypothetical protein